MSQPLKSGSDRYDSQPLAMKDLQSHSLDVQSLAGGDRWPSDPLDPFVAACSRRQVPGKPSSHRSRAHGHFTAQIIRP